MNEGAQRKFIDEIRRPLEQEGFFIQKTLGKGAFGQVFLASRNSRLWAIKSISKAQVKKRPFLQKYIKQEIEAMHTFKHQNIVLQNTVIETLEYYFMVLQYCDMGNLLTYQSKLRTRTFSLKESLDILVEIMKGLKYIHDHNYIHRDIKSENVLIKSTERGVVFKIADFGFARPINSGTASTICGTQKYMAPQILKNRSYTKSVDIWALGILLYFMLYAEYPFKGHDLLADIDKKCHYGFNIRQVGLKADQLKECNQELESLFRNIFVIDSKKRITLEGMINHPLFKPYLSYFAPEFKHTKSSGQKKEIYVNPQEVIQNHCDNFYQAYEDESRADLIGQNVSLSNSNKAISREITTTSFEISKISYLRECANDIFNYSNILKIEERVAFRYYVLRAFVFYSSNLVSKLQQKSMPYEFFEYNLENWGKFTCSQQYKLLLQQIREQYMVGSLEYEDAYNMACTYSSFIKIENFIEKVTPVVDDLDFSTFKIPYRSTTSYIYKRIHENKDLDMHSKNKLKLKIFCCHMINRIFNQNELDFNFEWYVGWLAIDPRSTQSKLDFSNFKKWIMCESKENLNKNITKLHRIFFK